jgi:hypothetical protein
MNYWPATNASACNELLARNSFQVLLCHHAVSKDTHAGLACNECFGMQ